MNYYEDSEGGEVNWGWRETNRKQAKTEGRKIDEDVKEYKKKLASLEATIVRNSAHRPSDRLTGAKCRATSIAQKEEEKGRVSCKPSTGEL